MDLRSAARWIARATLMIVAGVTVAFLVVLYSDYEGAPWLPSARPLAFVAYTMLVFWSVVGEYRASWKRTTFWLWLVGFMAAHIIAYVFVLAPVHEWRLIWFLPLSLVDFAALVFILDRLGYKSFPIGRVRASGDKRLGTADAQDDSPQIARRGNFTIYDPRKQQELTLELAGVERATFSNLQENVLVIDGRGIDWSVHSSLLDDAFSTRAQQGFVIYRPWWPGIDKKLAAFAAAIDGEVRDVGPVQLGILARPTPVFTVMELDRQLGSGAGVWLAGTTHSVAALCSALERGGHLGDPPIFAAAAALKAKLLGGALALDEGGCSTLLLPLAPDSPPVGQLLAAFEG